MRKDILLAFSIAVVCQILFSNSAFAKKAKVPTPHRQYLYEQKQLRALEIEKYKRSLLPQSGFMTREEYENLSKDIPNSSKVIPEYKEPKDMNMKYVPQPTYKLVHYNSPPGSAELHIERKFYVNKQVGGGAITSPNKDIMVYPVLYYYANSQCTASDLYVIPLDKALPELSRVQMANVVKRYPEPILSTDKSISQKYIFRSMTPVDFSADGSKLLAKEKIGYNFDGIWQTNLWVYDFGTNESRKLAEVREAIRYYWKENQGLVLDEKRWDITPLGFDNNNPDRVIVSAYGYTGRTPKFLGNWSVDTRGEETRLVSLFDPETQVSINGFKLQQSGIVNPTEVFSNEKKLKKLAKKNKKADKKAKKSVLKQKKKDLKKRLKELKHEKSAVTKQYRHDMRKTAPTGIN